MADSHKGSLASVENFKGIWAFIQEFGDQSDVIVKKEDLKCAAFGDPQEKLLDFLIVKNKEGRIIGVASIFYLFSTWEGKFIFIDEFLWDQSAENGNDIDLILLKKTIQEALAGNCSRTQLYLNKSDMASIERHKALGGVPLYHWYTVRLPNAALIQLAEQPNNFKGDFTIRNATQDDVPSILYLIQCLAEYEREPNAVKIDEKVLLEIGFGKHSYYKCILAETSTLNEEKEHTAESQLLQSSSMVHNPRVIGMALYHDIYCKRRGKVLHLEDLFVKEEHRNRGLGTGLMRECAKIGVSTGCNEMDWQVLDWNTKAIDLYERLGGIILKDLVFVRYLRDTMTKLVEN